MQSTYWTVPIAVALLASCSSSSGSSSGPDGGSSSGGGQEAGATCSATAGGGASGSFPCDIGAGEDASSNTTVNLSSPAGDAQLVSILIEFKGDPADRAYSGTDVIDALADFKSADGSTEWQQMSNGGTDSQGSFTLSFSNVGTKVDLGANSKGWQGMHGTYVGTFAAKSGGSGTATLNVTF